MLAGEGAAVLGWRKATAVTGPRGTAQRTPGLRGVAWHRGVGSNDAIIPSRPKTALERSSAVRPQRRRSGPGRLSPFAGRSVGSIASTRRCRKTLHRRAGRRGSLNPSRPAQATTYTSVCSEISRASSTSTPRYRTVLSNLCPEVHRLDYLPRRTMSRHPHPPRLPAVGGASGGT
jgi:hypothetical protein